MRMLLHQVIMTKDWFSRCKLLFELQQGVALVRETFGCRAGSMIRNIWRIRNIDATTRDEDCQAKGESAGIVVTDASRYRGAKSILCVCM